MQNTTPSLPVTPILIPPPLHPHHHDASPNQYKPTNLMTTSRVPSSSSDSLPCRSSSPKDLLDHVSETKARLNKVSAHQTDEGASADTLDLD